MRTKLFAVLLSVLLFLPLAVKADINSDLDLLVNSQTFMIKDFATMAGFLASEFAAQVPFNATMGEYSPANVCGFPGIGFGGTVGASFGTINVEGFKSLKLDYLPVAADDIQWPNPFPIPAASIHIRAGIIGTPVFKMDFGVRFLPLDLAFKGGDADIKIKYNIFGIETRAQIMEDSLLSPLGILGVLNLDFISGMLDIRSTADYNQLNTNVNGTNYNIAVKGTNFITNDWTVQSLGLKLLVNKSLAFFNPFLGAGININMGTVNSAVGTIGEYSLSPVPSGTAVTRTTTVVGRGTVAPPMNFRLIAGFELSPFPFTKFFFAYEWGGQIFGLSGGLRFQIP